MNKDRWSYIKKLELNDWRPVHMERDRNGALINPKRQARKKLGLAKRQLKRATRKSYELKRGLGE